MKIGELGKKKLLLLSLPVVFLAVIVVVIVGARSKKPASSRTEIPNAPPPTSNNMVLADAVYADLAVHHELDNVSVFYFDGDPKNNIAVNSVRQWIPASTIKIFVAMYAFSQAAKGNLNLSDLVTISDNNAVASEIDTPDAPSIQSGQVMTIYDLVYKMITQSDNTAFNTLLDILDRREITKYAHDLGLVNTNVGAKLNLDDQQVQSEYQTQGYGDNTTTADDFATAFILIKGNQIPGASDLFMILSKQVINNMIPLNLPKEVVVAHKTGDLDPLYHDGGIIVGGNFSYILSVFTNLGNPNVVAHISELIYKRDPNLVGADIKPKETGGVSSEEQTIDPLVLNPPAQTEVLAESTPSAIVVPTITASDLGITPGDLSLEIEKNALPRLIFSVDSPLRGLVPAWLNLVKATAFFPAARASADILNLKYQLAEANQFSKNGQKAEAGNILASVDKNLVQVAQDKAVVGNSNLQNMVKSISEARFSVLDEELKNLSGDEKIQAIKTIADQARNTVENVQPHIPKAVSSTNVTQKPILGQVTGKSGGTLVVQTAGGQQVLLPAGQQVKMKDQGDKDVHVAALSSIPVGSAIAVVAETTSGNVVVPAFVLKNVPRQWVAPQPLKVLKVNTLNDTMVVSENGITTQVNITPETVIKGTDTSISLKDIKIGDSVVVRGTDISAGAKKSATPSGIPASPSASPSTSNIIPQAGTPAPSAATPKSGATIAPLATPAAGGTTLNKPRVIEGKVIQVVEKKSSGNPKPAAQPAKTPPSAPAPKPPEVKTKKP